MNGFLNKMAILCLVCLAVTAYGESAGELFKVHEEMIRTNRFAEIGDVSFFHAVAECDGGTAAGTGKAKLMALGLASARMRTLAEWPDGTSAEERIAAWELIQKENPETCGIEGVEVVSSSELSNRVYGVVIAVPTASLKAAAPSKATLAKYLARVRTPTAPAPPGTAQTPEPPARKEPRGYWKENEIHANETLSDDDF